APVYTQTVPLTGLSASTSPGFTTTAAGTYHWTAHYSGSTDDNTADRHSPDELVCLGPPEPSITTTPDPTGGTLRATCNDSATASGCFLPTDTLSFPRHLPSFPTRRSSDLAPVYTQTVPLTGLSASTSPGFTTTAAGTYHWTAHYSG